MVLQKKSKGGATIAKPPKILILPYHSMPECLISVKRRTRWCQKNRTCLSYFFPSKIKWQLLRSLTTVNVWSIFENDNSLSYITAQRLINSSWNMLIILFWSLGLFWNFRLSDMLPKKSANNLSKKSQCAVSNVIFR